MKRLLLFLLIFFTSFLGAYANAVDSSPLIITEVMIGSEVNPEKDFWIEFYNRSDQPIDLSNWKIKGVTKGGRWISISTDEKLIPAHSFFLYSRYSNSSSSALEIKPNLTKSTLIPSSYSEVDIQIEDGIQGFVDHFLVEHELSGAYRAYERQCLDGDWSSEFKKSDQKINLKSEVLRTFGSPGEGCLSEGGSTDDLIEYPKYELINEIMMDPKGLDAEGEWIELFNESDHDIDLTNWYLDDAEGASKPFKINRIIKSKNYLTLRNPELNLSFKNSSDVVRILDPNKKVIQEVYYSNAKEGQSYAKNSSGHFLWTKKVTLNKKNIFPLPPKAYFYQNIKFKKILANPNGYDKGNEKITLINQLQEEVNLEGWKIEDQKGQSYSFDKMSLLPTEEKSFNPQALGLSLINQQGELRLYDRLGNLIDEVRWEAAKTSQWNYHSTYFPEGIGVEVIEAIDGDTLLVDFDDRDWKVRLIGIDAPETVHPDKEVEFFGIEASDYLTRKTVGRLIHLYFDESLTDSYGRLLAYVHLGNEHLNAEMIKGGYARFYGDYPFKRQEEFEKYEKEAKSAQLGLWKINELKSLPEVIEKSTDQDLEKEEVKEEDLKELPEKPKVEICPDEGLSIQSILPNEVKGASTEYIQVVNKTKSDICLKGWSLDDHQKGGSKPYFFNAGKIAAHSAMSFKKTLTKIQLNNSKDCASLINPKGKLIDQICYKKAKKGQVITHFSEVLSEETPKKKEVKKSVEKKRGDAQPRVYSSSIPHDFKWQLKTDSVTGALAFLYSKDKLFYLNTNQGVIPISYKYGDIDFEQALSRVSPDTHWTLAVKKIEDDYHLIGIESFDTSYLSPADTTFSFEWRYLSLIFLLVIVGFTIKKFFLM